MPLSANKEMLSVNKVKFEFREEAQPFLIEKVLPFLIEKVPAFLIRKVHAFLIEKVPAFLIGKFFPLLLGLIQYFSGKRIVFSEKKCIFALS